MGDEERVQNNDIWKLIDLYFDEKYVLYQMHYNSYNQFIEDTVFSELLYNPNVIHENVQDRKVYRYKFKFENIVLKAPSDENNDEEILFPKDARMRHITYAGKLMADVKQLQEIEDLDTGIKETKVIAQDRVIIARLPIMVRSKYCSTNIKKDIPNLECNYDPGCYFIVKGSEKVVISHERITDNKILVFTKKDNNYPDGILHTAQVSSKSAEDYNGNQHTNSIKMLRDRSIVLTMKYFSEIPIFILFRALGLVSDHDIINNITYDETDVDLINIIKPSLNNSMSETYKDDKDVTKYVRNQEDAIQYFISKLKTSKRYNETDLEIRNMQKREHLMMIFETELFPHMGKNILTKAFYLGLMCNKLLQCVLGRTDPDDRDSYINKRIDLPGALMGQLFKQYYRKMLNECSKTFKKRMGGYTTDTNPINVISQIKPMTIEQGFNSALATGTWGSNKRKGVALMLQRLTYQVMVSYLRRVITPAPDASTTKMDKMRHVHSVQYGFIDAVETPEGEKVGLHKHLALSASISINSKDQPKIIKHLISDRILYLTDIPPVMIKMLTKVFMNGEWLGMSNNPIELTDYLRDMRRNGSIDKTVGIIHHFDNKEIRINTDGGRLYRPLLRVKNNKLLLTKDQLEEIELIDKTKTSKIIHWNNFISKFPDAIEYVDIEEAECLMIAMTTKELDHEYNIMLTTIDNPQPNGNMANRYNTSVYRKYTHCELHPSMMLGTISSNIPFSEHNVSPRNYYNFAQSRQGMGINASNIRHRMDLTYFLYHPQVPLVQTRAAKYTNMIDLPAGENIIVAIATYTGYNQEDSIVINKSAIDRGLFRGTYFSKYNDVIQKNPATSQDDEFKKPDPNQTLGMQHGNFEKLNEKGYVEEETFIEHGDFIIGKVSPTQAAGDNKIYKDASTKYKSIVPGVIDKVYTGILNADNFEMYNVKVRSERVPRVGDKFCMDGDHEVLTNKGWIRFDEMYYRYKLGEEFLVASLHEGKYINYDKPLDVYEFDYEGHMYKLQSKQVDFNVTLDHEMYVKKKDKNYFESVKASDIYGKRYNLKKDGWIDIPDIDTIDINGKEFKMDDFLDFLGIFITDGRINHDHISFFGDKEYIIEVCKKSDIKYTINDNKLCIWNTELINWLKQFDKTLPESVFNLNTHQSRILLNSILSRTSTDKNYYCTPSKKMADDIMKLAIHAGWSGSINNAIYGLLGVNINKYNNEPEIDQYQDQIEELIEYNGKVYCLEVPSHVFMVRYNNKNVWMGNCSRHGQKGTIGITIAAEDMPFTESGIQPDIIINTCCFTGDTLISTTNGLSKRIDSFSDQGLEKVWTFNDENGFIPSFSLGLENKGNKDIVQITMYDGRTITCTPDHKFKIKTDNGFEYKEAKDIKINEDEVVMGLEYTEDKVFEDEKDWSLKVGEYEFNMKDNINREKSLAFARILGYLSTDGTICLSNKTYVGRVNMGHELDAQGILHDIEIITGKTPNICKDHMTYNINIPSELINNIVQLEDLMTGRRTTQEATLPTFLFEDKCPKAIIREFLGTFFAGDGHSPYILNNLFSTIKLSQSIIVKYKKSLEQKMNNIIKLLEKLDVKAKIIRSRDCHKNTELYQNEPRVQYEIGIESNIDFLKNIGFRHCLEKSARLTIAVSYERFYNSVMKQTQNLLQKIDEIFINEKIQMKDVLIKARAELYASDKPLDSFYSVLDLTYVNNKRRANRKDKPIIFKHDRLYSAEEYIKKINCEDWFSRTEDGKMNYIVKKDNNYVPYFTMKVNNIKDVGKKEVFDIGVAHHHNFIAEGVNVSNCIPSRMTIGQLMECVLGKASAIGGHLSDATPFEELDIEEAKKVLKDNGFNDGGYETMYCGYTGKKMEAQIFIGPTYYLRLKHMVLDKAQTRARGPTTILTRQPTEGKAREGGLKFGEMERDAMISHGMSRFLKERFMETSDAYNMWICNKCGLIARKDSQREYYVCDACGDKKDLSQITVPYAFKLMVQELMAINILPRLRAKK